MTGPSRLSFKSSETGSSHKQCPLEEWLCMKSPLWHLICLTRWKEDGLCPLPVVLYRGMQLHNFSSPLQECNMQWKQQLSWELVWSKGQLELHTATNHHPVKRTRCLGGNLMEYIKWTTCHHHHNYCTPSFLLALLTFFGSSDSSCCPFDLRGFFYLCITRRSPQCRTQIAIPNRSCSHETRGRSLPQHEAARHIADISINNTG
jgi:hypothetical protein